MVEFIKVFWVNADWMDRLFIVSMVAIMLIAIIGAIVMWSNPAPVFPCASPISQTCIDYRMDACLRTERYTRQECIDLVGSK